MFQKTVEEKTVDAVRVLSAEGVQKANSGHPGIALGAAPVAYTLYADVMKYAASQPGFCDRDRFVLSAGHGSMLLYACLHLFGFGLKKEDLAQFRQDGSQTPGHPEYAHTVGVETSTGPLGQGVANAVGFAAAEKLLAARFNRPGLALVDHYTYCLAGDGCMMEGIESEAASLAGTWGLGKLIVFYDSNGISIEGSTRIAFREDVGARHLAQGWQVLEVADGNDVAALRAAVAQAKADTERPSLIVVHTIIGYGSPNQGSEETHGAPLGTANLAALKANLNWTSAPFEVPAEVAAHAAARGNRGEAEVRAWEKRYNRYRRAYPAEAKEFDGWLASKPLDKKTVQSWLAEVQTAPEATRSSGGIALKKLSEVLTNLCGGSADLSPSTKTYLKGRGDFSKETPDGLNFHFGVREHAMAAICNGLQLHGGLRAYASTFFVFADYMRGAMRVSALMKLPVLYVLTHDSIGVGEDGPTHQPVEQLAGLRLVPNMRVFRPADRRETYAAYAAAMDGTGPTCVVLSRQNLPPLPTQSQNVTRGGYVVADAERPEVILMGSGSEVGLLLDVKKRLEGKKRIRVVSMPCMEVFDAQTPAYKNAVLPKSVRRRVAVEAGATASWYKYVGLSGAVVGIDRFGVSAPAERVFEAFGFTAEHIEAVIDGLK
ncbi:MAG: transketolase [Clostridiales bacterium]|jgi:transketolase|nr:transketolase [Clostridiales bacterium]